MESNQNQTPEAPKWVQTRSWEVELLISGGAIISLLQLHDFLLIQIDKISTVTFFQTSVFSEALISILLLAIYFAAHLVIRAYWLSIVFLNKLFPDGIGQKNSNLVEPYQTMNKRYDLVKQISVIDTLCSLIFCWSFTSALIVIGAYLSITTLTLPSSINSAFFLNFPFQIIALPLILSFFIFLFDLFTFGTLRKHRVTGKLFLPIYWLWNKISLGFIWRPNLELMFSNFKKKWAIALTIALIFTISLYLPKLFGNYLIMSDQRKHNLAEISIDEGSYMDKYLPEQWQNITIQSDVITDDYVKIFISYSIGDDWLVDKAKANDFSSIIKVSINDSIYTKVKWAGIAKRNGQKGIQGIINVRHLENGLHVLKVEELNSYNPSIIPFWKE